MFMKANFYKLSNPHSYPENLYSTHSTKITADIREIFWRLVVLFSVARRGTK